MTKLKLDISMSLDGYIAGPDATSRTRSARAAMRLHEWVFGLKSFRKAHGMEGGDADSPDNEIVAEVTRGIGAVVMGRKMFSGGAGPWESDPNADAWWGDDPPFHVPVFVLTHHEREPLVKQGGTTFHFVTGGIGSALEQARAAAGDQDISLAGGASVVQQYLAAGLWTNFRSTSCRSCWAAASASSTAPRLPRSSWKRRGWWRRPPSPISASVSSR